MPPTTPKNKFTKHGPLTVIHLDPAHDALIATPDIFIVAPYHWRTVKSGRCYYAKTTVGPSHNRIDLSMHRLINKTPPGLVCHHRNRNSLDNRHTNLINMSKKSHDNLHANNNLTILFDPHHCNTCSDAANQPPLL